MKEGRKELNRSVIQDKPVFFDDVPVIFEESFNGELVEYTSKWNTIKNMTFDCKGEGIKSIGRALD
jgi:hypothetical protein